MMTKREYCESRESIAYYSGLNGLEIKGIEYGPEDRIFCVPGAWYGGKAARRFHCVKIRHDRHGEPFFKIHGYKIPLAECFRTGV